jgi:hypothetical protein
VRKVLYSLCNEVVESVLGGDEIFFVAGGVNIGRGGHLRFIES